jgi:hypothetical protein
MLPEYDREFLESKGLLFTERSAQPGPRALIVHEVVLPEGKYSQSDAAGGYTPVASSDILIKIPDQYPDAALDSFYTRQFLKLSSGYSDPPNASGTELLFDENWQFWSRHLNPPYSWRPGVDSLATYWNLVLKALRSA